LQAEEELFPAELSWAAARANLCITFVDIFKATGGGWIDDAAKIATVAPATTSSAAITPTPAAGK
jgi:outer membrane protein, multidrug efflux system